MQRPLYAHRLNRDVTELFNDDYTCSSSKMSVIHSNSDESFEILNSINLSIIIFEGPYRGGQFLFRLLIPSNYPFKSVEIWSQVPIWHPNIELITGKVALPFEWSPVLSLRTIALAVQMLMLEPSNDNPLNLDALQTFSSNYDQFDQDVQKSLRGGCQIQGCNFINLKILASNKNGNAEKKPSDTIDMEVATSEDGSIMNDNQLENERKSKKRVFNHALEGLDTTDLYSKNKRENISSDKLMSFDDSNQFSINVMEAYKKLSIKNIKF